MGDIRFRKRAPAPLPPMWLPPPKGVDRTPLTQFVVLSMLLHAMLILLFGAPSGGSREGRAMWGSMQVLLIGPPRDPPPSLKIDRTPVLPAAPAPAPRALDPSVAREIERTAVPPAQPPQPIAIPPLLDRLVTPEPRLQMSPMLQLPPPTEATPQPPTPPPPVEAKPAPIDIPAPLVAPPAVTLPAPLETPALPALVPTPPVERAPIEVPALPAPTLETLAPMSPTQVREFDRIEPRLPPARIEPAPAPPTLRTEPVAPPRTEPAPAARPEPPPVRTEPAPALRPEAPPAVRTEPAEAPSLFKAPPGREERGGNNYDPTAPAVDLDAIRSRAGELARQGTGNRAVLPFPMPPVPDRKTKMETAIENARKPDCRTAYQSLGLAAIVPLIANEFGEGKCRW